MTFRVAVPIFSLGSFGFAPFVMTEGIAAIKIASTSSM